MHKAFFPYFVALATLAMRSLGLSYVNIFKTFLQRKSLENLRG